MVRIDPYFTAGLLCLAGAMIGTEIENRKEGDVRKEAEQQITGTVLEEVHGKRDSYTLKIKRDDNGKTIALSVREGNGKKEALDLLVYGVDEVGIENATRVSFPKGVVFWHGRTYHEDPRETYFHEDTSVGTRTVDYIKVLD